MTGQYSAHYCQLSAFSQFLEPTTAPPTPPPPPQPKPCNEESPEDGWVTADTLPDYCYYKEAEIFTWHEANEGCLQKHGNLVSFHSEEENSFVSTLLHETSFWNGLVKVHKGGQRRWTDNSNYEYAKWKEGGTSSLFI